MANPGGESSCPACSSSPTSRRGLLGSLAGIALGLLLWPGRALARKLAVKLEQAPQLKNVGGWVALQVKGKEVLFVRDGASSVRAFQSSCTHKHTLLRYLPGTKQLECPGHGSRFDLQGKVLKGPADKPIPTYPASLELAKNRIVVDLP
jgi:nitrite reductase/ring-hydroxylating ferredoxin subunit